MSKASVDVAIAILLHKTKVLVGWRTAEQHQGNKHEFPGGKVECGETPEQACRREIYEEVGVGLKDWHIFDVIRHEYEDIIVNLHLFHAYVEEELLELIHQPWTWYSRDQLAELNFPKANASILQRLTLPHLIKIHDQLSAIPKVQKTALFYWRMSDQIEQVEAQLSDLADDQFENLMINFELWQQLKPELQDKIQTIHLKQSQLMQFNRGELVVGKRFIAACHDVVSLQHAHQMGCDAVLLSPVNTTTTHPDAQALGWDKFAELAQTSHLPVFALGGVSPTDMQQAQKSYAYGLAGIRQFEEIV